ncbi:SDR family NAD(P)-dependent oxidoreductase [Hyphomonas johnsonii]|jgi:NAD(P)-dependent dehydrogenase (short-subunit alcohol dehydrogenase family)|uniref:Oxidoreductase-like protein n=1 Tax=Hyphomonas johnsonii MHS-2 TaxID=1280950 RepID=A0A059FMH1_9PROT|nr:SDR family oxidoreductase [Hyphomonas johnsonii]KCZ91870.1 oxidoreductase-like protein [Hyphomonas johnsonii MHS-2]
MSEPVTAILGLGREVGDSIARRFSEQGHRVLAADPNPERLATARSAMPDDVILHQGELHTRLGLRNAFTAAIEGFGRIDNAVVIPQLEEPDTLMDFSAEKFDKAMARSIRGSALALRVFAERIIEQDDQPVAGVERLRQKGTVTFVLSYTAIASRPGIFSESIAQGGVLDVMRAGAIELADQAIRVNAIVAVRPREDKTEAWTSRRTPLGRTALADEIADACRFLASPEAAFITGEALKLDGGRSRLSGVIDD